MMHSLQHAPRPQANLFATSNRQSCQHAFSSGRISNSKRLAQTRHAQQLRQQRKQQVVQAAAATDVGTKAVQAIKKSVGGDVFVAGTAMLFVSKRIAVNCSANTFPDKAGLMCVLVCRWQWSTLSTDRAGAAAQRL